MHRNKTTNKATKQRYITTNKIKQQCIATKQRYITTNKTTIHRNKQSNKTMIHHNKKSRQAKKTKQ